MEVLTAYKNNRDDTDIVIKEEEPSPINHDVCQSPVDESTFNNKVSQYQSSMPLDCKYTKASARSNMYYRTSNNQIKTIEELPYNL